ncbi:MAG: sigma-54 interaction domain-containing protein [Vicinamibacterales bacterium]
MTVGEPRRMVAVAPALVRSQPMAPERTAVLRSGVRRPRVQDRRKGLGSAVTLLAERVAADVQGSIRTAFEDTVRQVLPVRYARLSVGQAIATGMAPVLRDQGVIETPVAAGLAVLEVATVDSRPLDEWEWQLLHGLSRLATLVIEIERGRPCGRVASPRRALSHGLVGTSPPMHALRDRIRRAARRQVPVLVLGESGVGKELVARQIHEQSARAQGPFVAVNCAALVETLVEAELFGIEDRTATGVRGRRGKFELADGGTLFLDEVGDLSLQAQAKLLRVAQERSLERVGGHATRLVDVRLVAATNRNLTQLVEQGRFRMDLFYRLNCVEIEVPPLRDRREDIPALIEFFLDEWGGAGAVRLVPEVMDALITYEWPGNVRELGRVIDRAVTLAEGTEILLEHLPSAVAAGHQEIMAPSLKSRSCLRAWASRYARLVLARCGNNKREACRALGITYHTLQAYLRYGERVDGIGRQDPLASNRTGGREVGPVARGESASSRTSPTNGSDEAGPS